MPGSQHLENYVISVVLSVAGGVPQVFLTAPSGTVQIPVSAVQLHQVGAERCSQMWGLSLLLL